LITLTTGTSLGAEILLMAFTVITHKTFDQRFWPKQTVGAYMPSCLAQK